MFKRFLTKPDFILLLVVLVLLPIFSGCDDSNNSTLPETIINSEISAGSSYSATIKDGSLFLWGYNSFGQLGTGNSTNENIPKQLSSVPAYWKQISVGYTHTAAIATNGTLWTWGDNGFGQLGVGNTSRRTSPTNIAFPSGVGGQGINKHKNNTVDKCTFCSHRVKIGLKPACVEHCPGAARYVGYLSDPSSEVSILLATRTHKTLLPEKGTDPSVYFLY